MLLLYQTRLLRNSFIPLLMIKKAENMDTPTKPISAITAIKNKETRVPSIIRIGSGTLLLLLSSTLPSIMRSKRISKSISMIVSPNKRFLYTHDIIKMFEVDIRWI